MAAKPSRAGASLAKARKYRVERDLLGTREVPANAYYGIHTWRALMAAGTGRHSLNRHPYYLRAMVKVKKAAALANRDARALPQRLANAIVAACDDILRDRAKYAREFPADVLFGGGAIAVNMNVNEVIANVANEILGGTRGTYDPLDPKGHVNASQSTSDVCHTAMRIAIILTWDAMQVKLDECSEQLASKAKEFRNIQTIARTCLQDASATSLGEMFGGYAAAIARRTAEIDRAVGALHQINLGGTVLGDGEGAPPGYRRAVLRHLNRTTNEWDPRGHFKAVNHKYTLRENLFDAAQNCDDLGNVAAQIGLLAEVLIKIAKDLRLLSSGPGGGFGEITMPAVIEGSSFYPGKINPVIAETLIQCCFAALGHERAARLALEHGELNLNVFEASAAIHVMDAMDVIGGTLGEFWISVRGITANKARCRELASFAREKRKNPMSEWKTEHVAGAPRIAVDHCGRGPLALFMHGIGGNRSNWHDQLPDFAEKFHAVAWDARGYGASDDYAGALDFADFGRDLLRVLDHFRVERAHLVGLSMGGLIAFDFHATYPGRVATLTICDSMPGMTGLNAEARREFIRIRQEPLLNGKEPRDIAPVVAKTLVGKSAKVGSFERLVASMAALHTDSYLKTIEATTNYARTLELEKIRVPTHIVVGAEDTLTPPALSRAMASRIAGARLTIINGAGHLSNIEQPEAFNAATLAFLLEHRGLAS